MIRFDRSRFDYSEKEVLEAAAAGRLLSAEIEFNRRCNYRCPYCYAAGEYENRMLTVECAESVIRQVAALGGRNYAFICYEEKNGTSKRYPSFRLQYRFCPLL